MHSSLFRLIDFPNPFTLESVYLNQVSKLHVFQIANLTARRLHIRFSSDLPSIGFQLSNANLCNDCDEDDGLEYNQVFNEIDFVDGVSVAGHETVRVIMTYLASKDCEMQMEVDSDRTFDYVRVDGEIVFACEDERSVVGFQAQVCQSVMVSDVGENGTISFDDCVVGGTFFKVFTVWNKSAIDLQWSVSVSDERFKLTYGDTGEAVDALNRNTVLPYSHQDVRIMYEPKEIGEVQCEMILENVNDALNSECVKIQAVSRATVKESLLMLSCNDKPMDKVLDFGNCCTGIWTRQRIVMRNMSDCNLELRFDSDCNLVFELSQEEEAGEMKRYEDSSLFSSMSGVMIEKSSLGLNSLELNMGVSSMTSSMVSVNSRTSTPVPMQEEIMDYQYQVNEMNVVEEMILKAGSEKAINVLYKAAREVDDETKAGVLVKRNFKICIEYEAKESNIKEKKKRKVCTSFIQVNTNCLDYGNVDVGTLKSLPITISNMSDVNSHVMIKFASKVLHCFKEEINIPARQSVTIKIDIFPRKVNPEYRKEIVVLNLLNRENDKIIQVKATNMDHQKENSVDLNVNLEVSTNNAILSKEQEELFENLQQKLKIAIRKNRFDKVNKIKDKLSQLENFNVSNGLNVPKFKKVSDSFVSFTLEPNTCITILSSIRVLSGDDCGEGWFNVDGEIVVREYKNADVVKVVQYKAVVCLDSIKFRELMRVKGEQVDVERERDLDGVVERDLDGVERNRDSIVETNSVVEGNRDSITDRDMSCEGVDAVVVKESHSHSLHLEPTFIDLELDSINSLVLNCNESICLKIELKSNVIENVLFLLINFLLAKMSVEKYLFLFCLQRRLRLGC
ncbi:hypothetical protein ROZALSC1DRAFT_20985 [Rozella allomycis CSF55]|uniref:Uncharacterized protein n=1 Tax=Rozella allomycis (strain CSF55) TaxID=988480 RepID=A0A4P9YN47_ROZAC|nr:hypothetical protein ROZALSC1DRAFT_20985 [Rozella allomycis CSF55]